MTTSKQQDCPRCGKQMPAGVVYTDGGGLAIAHGQYTCRECYIADGHPECPHCHELTASGWTYCCHCGSKLQEATQ